MKKLICIAALIGAASGTAGAAEVAGESSFHLLTNRCESESHEGPETTPQSPPLNVDDPSTPGCNAWEINVVVDGDFTRAQNSFELPLLDINYGIGDNLQLKYELPYLSNQADGTTSAAVGESKAGIKFMFFEDETSKLQLAAYPQLTFVSSRADVVAKGLASPGNIFTLPVLMAFKIGQTLRGDVDLTANLGYNISTKSDVGNFISASLGVGTPIFRNVSIMGELATEQAMSAIGDEARSQVLKADIGMVGTLSRQFLLFGALGHSLSASDALEHSYGLIGFRLLSSINSSDPRVASAQP